MACLTASCNRTDAGLVVPDQGQIRGGGDGTMTARLDRYLMRSFFGLFAGLTLLALALLLLERLIRITDLVSGSDNGLVFGSLLIANLVPHYLNLAMPGAFLIAMILTVDRLSRSGEIVALLAAGVSVYRLMRPFMLLAVLLAASSLFISGFLQPLSRYSYREIVHNLQYQSVLAVFQEQKFVQHDNRIIWTSSVSGARRTLGQTFILESRPDGGQTILTGNSGQLRQAATGDWEISLSEGKGVSFIQDQPERGHDLIEYGELIWPVAPTGTAYRARGGDERELFLTELLAATRQAGPDPISGAVAAAAFHDRVSRAALLLALPMLAFVLGLNLGRIARATGVVYGILILLGIQKALEYGLSLAGAGSIPGWAGFWPLVLAVTFLAAVLLRRVTEGRVLTLRPRRPDRPLPEYAASLLRADRS